VYQSVEEAWSSPKESLEQQAAQEELLLQAQQTEQQVRVAALAEEGTSVGPHRKRQYE
jgi:hypothetical protein